MFNEASEVWNKSFNKTWFRLARNKVKLVCWNVLIKQMIIFFKENIVLGLEKHFLLTDDTTKTVGKNMLKKQKKISLRNDQHWSSFPGRFITHMAIKIALNDKITNENS